MIEERPCGAAIDRMRPAEKNNHVSGSLAVLAARRESDARKASEGFSSNDMFRSFDFLPRLQAGEEVKGPYKTLDRPKVRVPSTTHDGWDTRDDLPYGRVAGVTPTFKPRCSSSR